MENIIKCPQCNKNYESEDCIKEVTKQKKIGDNISTLHAIYFCQCTNCLYQYAWHQEQHIARFRKDWLSAEKFLKNL